MRNKLRANTFVLWFAVYLRDPLYCLYLWVIKGFVTSTIHQRLIGSSGVKHL